MAEGPTSNPLTRIALIIVAAPWVAFIAKVGMTIWLFPKKPDDARWAILTTLVHFLVTAAIIASAFAYLRWQLDYVRAAVFVGMVVLTIYVFYGKSAYDTIEYIKKDVTRKRAAQKKAAQRNLIEIAFVMSMMLTPALLLGFAPPELMAIIANAITRYKTQKQ